MYSSVIGSYRALSATTDLLTTTLPLLLRACMHTGGGGGGGSRSAVPGGGLKGELPGAVVDKRNGTLLLHL
jgi:hypothetical protein